MCSTSARLNMQEQRCCYSQWNPLETAKEVRYVETNEVMLPADLVFILTDMVGYIFLVDSPGHIVMNVLSNIKKWHH